MRAKLASLLNKMLPLLFWIGVWALCYRGVGQDLLLASPLQVAQRLASLFGDASFGQSVAQSLARAATAYVCGITVGVLIAGLCAVSPLAKRLLSPALGVIRATPVTSFIVLALVWLSSSRVPILTGFLMVLPVVFANVSEGIESADPQLLEMSRMFRFTHAQTLRHIYLPTVAPTLLTACEACIGLCFKASIAAEVIGVPRGAIGTRLYNAKIYLETDNLMAWTLVVVLLSIALEKLLRRAISRVRKEYTWASR